VTRVAERLKSADPEAVRAALMEVKEAGKQAAPAAPAVADLLRRGTTPTLAALALGALAVIGGPAQAGVVAGYAHHRVADLRSKAVVALGTCGGEAALPTLRQALGDVEPAVRGSAASALGGLGSGARPALADLYAALDRNVLEAAAAIGQLCVGEECAAFSAKTGRIGLDVMVSGFDALLFRPSNEVPDQQKIKVVERVRDLRTIEANKYLRDLQSRGATLSPRVKQTIDEAVLATAGATS
jgi:HEAT repeat protein